MRTNDKTRLGRNRRRGAAVILVLGLLAITLATTYALTRTQFRAYQIHNNSQRSNGAREAATSGLTHALRRMHDSDWGGVGSTVTGNIDDEHWYVVNYETGDPELVAGAADYEKYPYRVTLKSVGYAQNPDLPSSPTKFTTISVVELVPRSYSSSSPDWTEANAHTVRQWMASSSSRFQVEPRVRIEGPVRVGGAMTVNQISPLDNDARNQLLSDLRRQYQQDGVDHRPFNGDLEIDYRRTSSDTRDLLRSNLGLTVRDTADDSSSYSHPGALKGYQLYPGGRDYEVPLTPNLLVNVSLQPDMKENPLGLFASSGAVVIGSNVSIDGTLIVGSSDLRVSGENLRLNARTLPPLDGETEGRKLPTAIVRDDLRILLNSTGELSGLFAVWDEFELTLAPQNSIGLSLDGRLLAKEVLIRPRLEWAQLNVWWDLALSEFRSQQSDGEALFNKWLDRFRGLPSEPILTIQPESGAVAYHWPDWDRPVFAPHPNDEGLRWRVVRWGENQE